jgi:hypothetical protein
MNASRRACRPWMSWNDEPACFPPCHMPGLTCV